MLQEELADVHGEIKWDAASAAIGLLSRKWVIAIIRELARQPLRHNELRRAMGDDVADKALTRALRSMTESHVVTREIIDTAPPGVRYDLAPLGRSLLSAIHSIGHRWTDQQPTHQSGPRLDHLDDHRRGDLRSSEHLDGFVPPPRQERPATKSLPETHVSTRHERP